LFLLQILPQRMGVFAIDIDLLEQVKLDLAVTNETLNLLGVSWFLMVELVTGERKNAKT
jgi:hypothetical protein